MNIVEEIWTSLTAVRSSSPLIHNITNYVVMNNTANALLAIGASPIMSHAHPEVIEMVRLSSAVIINIGTLDEYWAESMIMASREACHLRKPWIFDPVGAGASTFRNKIISNLLSFNPSVIRGNASEIIALHEQGMLSGSKGVDSVNTVADAENAAKALSQKYNAVVCVSGQADYIVYGNRYAYLRNGHPMMAAVTGLGCTATAMIGAFAAVIPQDIFLATVAAMSLLSVCGEIAAKASEGPGTLQVRIIDNLHAITQSDYQSVAQITTGYY